MGESDDSGGIGGEGEGGGLIAMKKGACGYVYYKVLGIVSQVGISLQGYELEVVFTIAMPIILTAMLAALLAGLQYIVRFSNFSFGG